MRILVDITHPAHVHFYRNAILLWREHGHDVFATARRKDITADLLRAYSIEFEDLGASGKGLGGLGLELAQRVRKLRRVVRRVRPDVLTAIGGVYVAHAGWLSRKPSVIFYDTENAWISNFLTYPFCTAVCTPSCYEGWVPASKHLTYRGYHELAYTHPNRFTPDLNVLQSFGLQAEKPFVVMRLVSWAAAHDVRDHGFTGIEAAVRDLERFARVVISSEGPLPKSLENRRLEGPQELVHHLLAFASLYIGESATMASESATLGTPAIFVSTSVRGYTNEQEERYGLAFTFNHPRTAQMDALIKGVEILSNPDTKSRWQKRRRRMIADKIDVTEHIVEVVESYGRRDH